MAQNNSTGDLFLTLGLDVADLESGFVAVENSVRENLARLNRESNLIRLRAEVEVGNLDAATQAVEILTVKENALNEQLKIQSDRVKLMEAAYQQLIQKHGEGAAISQKNAAALERERLKLQQIQKELQSVNQAQEKLNQSSQATKSNLLLDSYNKLKGNFADSLGGLSSVFAKIPGAANLADGAITKVLGTIGKIPVPVGLAITAIAGLPTVVKKAEDSLLKLATPAIETGDAFYVMSRGLQMSIADTGKLSTICKVTGIEINEVISSMRRLNMRLVKSDGSDSLSKTLRQYGVEARNASGELKNAYEMSIALAEGLSKAQKAGKGKEFIASTLGRSATGDMVTYLEDLTGNIEQAKKVVKNGLFDPVRAHAIQGEINTLNAQAGQLKSAFSNAFLPISEKIVPHATQRLGELTKVIAENAEGIKVIGEKAAKVVTAIEDVATGAAVVITKFTGAVGEALSHPTDENLIQKYLNDKDVKSVQDLIQREINFDVTKDPNLYQKTLEIYQPQFQALEDARKKIKAEIENIKDEFKSISRENFNSLKGYQTPTNEDLETLRKANEETKKLSDEIYKLKHTDSENKELDVYNWQEKLLNDERTTSEQRILIEELTNLKLSQIEQEKEEKISAIRKAADAEFQTDLQNRLDKIDEEKEKWLSAGMEQSEANIIAERKKTQEISKLNSEITSELDSLYQSALENRLAQIEKEKQAYIQKGVDEVKAAEWAEEQKAKAAQEAAKNILKQQAKEYDIYQKEGYGGLQAYKRGQLMNDLAKAGINPNYLYMTPEQARDFQSANETAEKSLMPNMMSQKDREENVKRLENWYNSRNLSKGEHILDSKESDNTRETLSYNPYDYYRNEMQQSGGIPKDYKSPITSANNEMLAQLADEMKKVGAKEANVLLGSDGKPIGYAYAHGEPEKESEQPQNLIDNTAIDEFTDQMHNATENFNAMNDAIRNVSYSPAQANQQFANSYSSIPSGVQYASGTPSIPSAYSDQYLTPIEQPTIQQTEMPMLDAGLFGDLSEQTVILTQNFSKLGEVIANITLSPDKQQPQHYSDSGSSQQQTPQPINNNIQINEAHAWDSEHIQELAEKVADVIRPALEQALGGNSNAY